MKTWRRVDLGTVPGRSWPAPDHDGGEVGGSGPRLADLVQSAPIRSVLKGQRAPADARRVETDPRTATANQGVYASLRALRLLKDDTFDVAGHTVLGDQDTASLRLSMTLRDGYGRVGVVQCVGPGRQRLSLLGQAVWVSQIFTSANPPSTISAVDRLLTHAAWGWPEEWHLSGDEDRPIEYRLPVARVAAGAVSRARKRPTKLKDPATPRMTPAQLRRRSGGSATGQSPVRWSLQPVGTSKDATAGDATTTRA